MESILNYISQACGFVIDAKVPITGWATNFNIQPTSCEEMLVLVEQELADHGYAMIRDGNKLTIISAAEAKRSEIPVIHFTDLSSIPATSNVVSCVMPSNELNPIEFVRSLNSLRSATNSDLFRNMNIVGGEAGSLLITDQGSVVRRAAAVMVAMEKIGPDTSNVVRVIELKNADAGETAKMMTELFPLEPTAVRGASQSFRSNKVFAIGDNATRSVIVTAPPDVMPEIADAVAEWDMGMTTNHVSNSFTNVRPHSRQVMMSAPAVQTDDARPKATGF